MKKILYKDAQKALTNSFGRYVGIMLLMLVSSFAFIGLKMAGPDMRLTAQDYYQKTNLADLTIQSNYGLDKRDLAIITSKNPDGQLEPGYLIDSSVNNSKIALRVMSLTKHISKNQIVKGRLPQKDNQIAISATLQKEYHLGQKISLNNHQNLATKNFQIVGFIKPSEYTAKTNIGQTTVGIGQLSGVALVTKSAFKNINYNIVRLRFTQTKKLNPYSKSYQNFVTHQTNLLKPLLAKNGQVKWLALQNKLRNQQKYLTRISLVNSKATQKAQELQTQLNSQKIQLQQLGSPHYYLNTRSSDPGYEDYRTNSEKIDLVTNIFPVFFFAVAALVSFASMARFIDDERQNIGILRALGYSKFDASIKFIIYSLSAALTGVFLGAIGGYLFLPRLIFKAYTVNLNMGDFKSQFSWQYLLLTIIIAILCTTGAAMIQLFFVLKEKVNELLLPKPPRNGAHILLERIRPFWNNLNFNYKVTLRNIFRYKAKMLMTILGLAGCTGLLIMGFGIRDSLTGIGQKQYGDLIKYDLIALNKPALSPKQQTALTKELHSKLVKRYLAINFDILTKKIENTNQQVSVITPSSEQELTKYFTLRQRKTNNKLDLNSNGAIVSEKLAQLLNIKVGQKLVLNSTTGKKIAIPVSGICEMYMGHYVLMNRHTYKQVFNQKFQTNAQLIILTTNTKLQVTTMAQKLMQTTALKSINLNINNKKIINNLISSMNNVMYLLIGLAIILAIVVIFTLTTTNLEERMREISTIKVLGFYNNEAAMYVYRETLLLSIVGILIGFFIGNWLHGFIINNLAPLDAMFKPGTLWTNYVISAVIPLLITGVLAIFVYYRIKKVDMLEALKSVD